MNKNFKVITINGLRGILAAIFVVFGLIAGFVISPGWVCMKIWNYLFEQSGVVSVMNLFQGVMLWAIIALSLYALNNKRALIGFGSYPSLTPEQIKNIMEKTKKAELKLRKDLEVLETKNSSLNIKPDEASSNEELPAEDKEEMRK